MSGSEVRTIEYGSSKIAFDLAFKDRKQLAIHVHPDLRVTVEAPLGIDLAAIEDRVRKRGRWILRQQRDFERYSFELPPRKYVSGETHRYLGKQYRLKVVESADQGDSVKLARGRIIISTRDAQDKVRIKKQLDAWYRRRAIEVIGERSEVWLPRFSRYDKPAHRFVIRKMKSRWGSCTRKGVITLNLKLIQKSKPLIDYILVHELCHLVEPDHSPAFYALLQRVMPDWRDRRETLNRVV